MGHSTAYRQVSTSATLGDVIEATALALRRVGGVQTRNGNVITVRGGTNGVKMGFVAEVTATVAIAQKPDGAYEIRCQISYSPNTLFWICLVVGLFFLWFLWIINFLYLFVNAQAAYQASLDAVALPPPTSQPGDRVQLLSRLKSMLDAGLITQEEFNAMLAEILAKL